MRRLLIAGISFLVVQTGSSAVLLTNFPSSAETTIHGQYPNNNFGTVEYLAAGQTLRDQPARGLFRFDQIRELPGGTRVRSVQVQTAVISGSSVGIAPESFALHRVTRQWVEGLGRTRNGSTANPGEATWLAAQNGIVPWTNPGGDFAAIASATLFVDESLGAKSFSSTDRLVSDVQHWIDNPDQNFGWILKAETEEVLHSSRRWARPSLQIEYDVGNLFEFQSIAIQGGNVVLRFTGGSPNYRVQQTTAIAGGTWQTLPTVYTNSPIVLPAASDLSFFRLIDGQ